MNTQVFRLGSSLKKKKSNTIYYLLFFYSFILIIHQFRSLTLSTIRYSFINDSRTYQEEETRLYTEIYHEQISESDHKLKQRGV